MQTARLPRSTTLAMFDERDFGVRMLDIEKLRHDTPACEAVLHLNHAGSSLPPRPVLEAIREHIAREERWGGYRAAHAVRDRIANVYADIGTLVGAARDEIALVDSATRAWQLAFSAVSFRDGDRIICSRTEYASNHLAFLQLRERVDVEIIAVPAATSGAIDLERFASELDQGAALVALTHVPTNSGLVQPAGAVGELCRAADVPLLLDACQSAGQVDLRTVAWDMIAVTGRKYLRGPRGTGFLGIRREWLDRLNHPLMDLHGATWTGPHRYEPRADARRFELWERNYADVLGLGAAVRYALDCGVEELESRIRALATALRERLRGVDGVTVRDIGPVRCGIVTFTVDGAEPDTLKAKLETRNVHVNVSRRSSTLLDMTDRGLDAVVRASVHALNTEAELDEFIRHLNAVRK